MEKVFNIYQKVFFKEYIKTINLKGMEFLYGITEKHILEIFLLV